MEDLSLHILDIVQNSIQAGARLVEICIQEDREENLLTITIRDDGSGMTEEEIKMVTDPFYSTKEKRTGLGIPLLAQSATEADGDITVESSPGKGTTVTARFNLNHIDRKPLGNLTSTVKAIIGGHPDIDLVFRYQKGHNEFTLDTRELRKDLEEVPLNYPPVLELIANTVTRWIKGIN